MNIKMLFIALLFFASIKAQPANYEIFLMQNVIGSGAASQYVNDDGSVNYVLKTEAKATVMFKHVNSLLDVNLLFKDDVLFSGTFIRETNGEYQQVYFKNQDENTYYIENGNKTLVEKPIYFTTTQFFFQEPKDIDEVYIERLNEFYPIFKDGNCYKTEVEGSINYYIYENGELVEYRMKNVVEIYMSKV